jgi:hypothetical protein
VNNVHIRYYSPYYDDEIHKEMLNLLSRIKTMHKIDYEVKEVPKGSDQVIYKRDFIPRARVVRSRVGEGVARIIRSRQGRGSPLVRGEITLVDDNGIAWVAYYTDPLYDEWKSYDEKHPISIGFLKMVLERGEELLHEIMSRGKESEHEKLVGEFISSNLLKGEFRKEVPVGKAMVMIDKYGSEKRVGRKSIDLVCDTPTECWVLEVEPELNARALGQALIYKELHPKEVLKQVRCGIVCKNAEDEVLAICERYVDKVFVLGNIWKKSRIDWSR